MPATIDCCVAIEKSRAPDKKGGSPSSQRPNPPNLAAVDGDSPGCVLPGAGVKARPPLAACRPSHPASKCLLRAARRLDRGQEDNQSPARASRFPCSLQTQSPPAPPDQWV